MPLPGRAPRPHGDGDSVGATATATRRATREFEERIDPELRDGLVLYEALGFEAKDLSGETPRDDADHVGGAVRRGDGRRPRERPRRAPRTGRRPAGRRGPGAGPPSRRRDRHAARAALDPRRRDDLREHSTRTTSAATPTPRPSAASSSRRVPPRPGASAPGAGRGLLRRAAVDGGQRRRARHRSRADRGRRRERRRRARRRHRCSWLATAVAPDVAFQLLVYPMLDDRDATAVGPASSAGSSAGAASTTCRAGRRILGDRVGTDAVDHYAAPARATDLSGLPPAFIQVGELETFRDEDIDYAARLLRAGVPTSCTSTRVRSTHGHGGAPGAPVPADGRGAGGGAAGALQPQAAAPA